MAPLRLIVFDHGTHFLSAWWPFDHLWKTALMYEYALATKKRRLSSPLAVYKSEPCPSTELIQLDNLPASFRPFSYPQVQPLLTQCPRPLQHWRLLVMHRVIPLHHVPQPIIEPSIHSSTLRTRIQVRFRIGPMTHCPS